MRLDIPSKKILITGSTGFTGAHLKQYLRNKGMELFELNSNLLDMESLERELKMISPDVVYHLAAISFVEHKSVADIYNVNVIGTLNLLSSIRNSGLAPKVILASSATVYGNQNSSMLAESMTPQPVNHYGCSKLSMELMSRSYQEFFQVIITRPFNYTGVGQYSHFLVPKIVNAFKSGQKVLELGNLDVCREFNDIRDICRVYYELLQIEEPFETINLCSGVGVSLIEIIEIMEKLSCRSIEVSVNANFVRKNEIRVLVGDASKLKSIGINPKEFLISDTLESMYLTN